MTRIVMADDHAVVRAGLRALIEQAGRYRIMAECSTAEEARAAVAEMAPDLLVLDISLPGGGLNLLSDLASSATSPAVLVLSMHTGEPYVSEALRRGASGYVTKGAAADELIDALEAIAAGGRYLSSDLQASSALPASGNVIDQLSGREREVFLQLARGATPKQVALGLGISVKTAYLHRDAVRRKLGVRNDLQLHQIASAHGLL